MNGCVGLKFLALFTMPLACADVLIERSVSVSKQNVSESVTVVVTVF